MTKLEKAADWIQNKAGRNYNPVNVIRDGFARFVAYIFRMEGRKGTVWFCVEMDRVTPTRIKRICTY